MLINFDSFFQGMEHFCKRAIYDFTILRLYDFTTLLLYDFTTFLLYYFTNLRDYYCTTLLYIAKGKITMENVKGSSVIATPIWGCTTVLYYRSVLLYCTTAVLYYCSVRAPVLYYFIALPLI